MSASYRCDNCLVELICWYKSPQQCHYTSVQHQPVLAQHMKGTLLPTGKKVEVVYI